MGLVSATYRLQFHRGFTLRDALELVPYLAELGVSHIYASPLLAARQGSSHGYDVCDPTRINPEIGTEANLAKLVGALRDRNMGLVLDIVPNHMSADVQNPWWRDVLQHGRSSRYATCFDIDWDSPVAGLRGKVLLPILGDELQRVLERHELRLALENEELVVRYFDHALPVSPESRKRIGVVRQHTLAALNGDVDALRQFLEHQHYRLAGWQLGNQALNYRRFFNITELAGVRVEDPRAFSQTHSRVLQWQRDQVLDGLRVDHPDGLYNPEKYLNDLRRRAPETWLVIEKILSRGETLPEQWPIQGTTGYDFLNRLGGLFVDSRNEPAFSAFYERFSGRMGGFDEVALEKKRLVLRTLFGAELDRLRRLLAPAMAEAQETRQTDQTRIRTALIELAACFPVYRTYVRAESGAVSKTDTHFVESAVSQARQNRPELADLLRLIEDFLLLRKKSAPASSFVMFFQQLTGPAMAKGVEDTAFYCYNRFVALNEVGGDPGAFGMTLASFHQSCHKALEQWPASMLATSTHDTKRSEDVRARLAVLSEMPRQWTAAVGRWSARLERYRHEGLPDHNAEYLFYQTLIGAWPLSPERALAYLRKAAREAKEYTSWSDPNPGYEQATEHFVTAAFEDGDFMADLEQFVRPLVEPGRINSLAQTLIKLTAPGVPDIYQGTELWDLSLVDPDNRRPVDFGLRRAAQKALRGATAEEAWNSRAEGLPKLWLIARTLSFRAHRCELFGPTGSYEPLVADGEQAQRVVAFVRGAEAATLTPRLVLGLKRGWGDTTLHLPAGLWQNELTSEIVRGGRVPLAQLLARFPVALLCRIND